MYVSEKHECVSAMCSSSSNNTLVLGDVNGFISVYDLSDIPEKPKTINEKHVKLVKRFKAHPKSVSSVAYVDSYGMILSAAEDCTVVLFDLYGMPIGFFGQMFKWQIGNPETYAKQNLSDLKVKYDPSEDIFRIPSKEEPELDSPSPIIEERKLRLESFSKPMKPATSRIERINTLESYLTNTLDKGIADKLEHLKENSSADHQRLVTAQQLNQPKARKKKVNTRIDENWTSRVSSYLELQDLKLGDLLAKCKKDLKFKPSSKGSRI